MSITKLCPGCDQEKDYKDFYKKKGHNRVHAQSWCRDCNENRKAENKQLKSKADRQRSYRHRHSYGLASAEYLAMVADQGGKCKICQQEAKLCVDHCHTTGKVRGLLCTDCNLMLGRAKDNPDTLQRGIEYLRST